MKLSRHCFAGILSTLILLAGCATAPPAPVYDSARDLPVTEKPEIQVRRPDNHIIRAGETLAGIALKYGLDYRELALWNGIPDANVIHPGDILRLSPPTNLPQTSAVVPRTAAEINPAPVLAPAPSAAGESGLGEAAAAAAIVSAAADNAAPPRGNAPVKDGPVAAKYAYNSRTLEKLRAEHKAGQTATPAAPETASVAPSPSAAAPGQTRRRFDVDWSWPTAGAVTRKFNEATKGIDIAGAKGDPIYAAADGKVVYTGSGVKSYGRLVILKHGNDYLSAYAHNDKILVKEGQKVARGEQISTVGDSGAAQPMLHLEIRKSGKPFDPLQVLPPKP